MFRQMAEKSSAPPLPRRTAPLRTSIGADASDAHPIWFLSSANRASTFFRCRCAMENSTVLANSRARCRAGSCWWITRQRKAALAHWPERARATPFARPDVGPGVVAMTASTVVQRLTCGTDIAIVFRFVSEALGTEERASLAMNAVASSHVGSDVALRQPLQQLSVPVRGVGRDRFWLSSLPSRKAGEHVLCSNCFLAHARCRRLHGITQLSLSTR
jgi:hypothetical protein